MSVRVVSHNVPEPRDAGTAVIHRQRAHVPHKDKRTQSRPSPGERFAEQK
jgi:hypothetical protein